MKTTIVIPTFKRHKVLLEALNSLLEQDTQDYRIIVVDQSPQADKIFSEFLGRNKDKIHYIKSNTKGAASARNVGWQEAGGDIIIFCDDDIIADRHLVRAHIDSYLDPKVGGVAGRVITEDDAPASGIRQVGVLREWDGKMTCNFNADFRAEVDHVWGCNMSFRRNLLERVGGFDERLVGTSSFDDSDVALAVKKLGYKIVFEPSALARHVYAKSGGCRELEFHEKIFWYYHNFIIFYFKHMKKRFFPIFLARQILGIFRRTITGKNLKVIISGFKGLTYGYRDYRSNL